MLHNFNDPSKNKQEFRLAIVNAGITPPEQIIDDGKLHRFPTNEKAGNKDGWYVLHSDGVPNGQFGCWRSGIESAWKSDLGRPYTAEELERLKEQSAKISVQRQIERKEAQLRAKSIWDKTTEAIDHPYIVKKGIKPYIARQYMDTLVIPLYQQKEIASLQFINKDSEKQFLKGGTISGSYCEIGTIVEPSPICICEGYATGATIHEATSYPVIVAFNAGNLSKVAKIVKAQYPNFDLIIAGDDDFQNEKNPGKKAATEAAHSTQARLIFPTFAEPRAAGQTDFNDMAQSQGLFSVGMLFQDALKQDPVGPKKFSLQQFSLNGQSEAMKQQMLEEMYVLERMAILGQFVVFYAAPNIGKTLLVIWMIIRAIENGQVKASDIFYINADDNHKGLTFKLSLAEKYGFHMLAPGYNDFDPTKLFGYIKTMIHEETAKGKVIVLDTLKKFTDIMRKDVASEFGKNMRAFVSHGGTVISLGHVNKHKNPEGKSVYGGTSDITDDADCYYMIEEIQVTEKTKTIRFENRKSRGDVDKAATFMYSNQKVSNYQELLDSVQTVSEYEAEALAQIHAINCQLQSNKEILDSIKGEIELGNTNKTQLISAVSKLTLVAKTKVKRILDAHTGTSHKNGHRWNYTVKDKNCHIYFLIDPDGEGSYRRQM
jgi:phage/plasmid primase-like uncharacterized protein